MRIARVNALQAAQHRQGWCPWHWMIIVVVLLMPMHMAVAQTVDIVDPPWEKSSNTRFDSTAAETLPPDDPFWQYTADVWNGPDTSNEGVPIPQPDFWAAIDHHNTVDRI